MIVELIMIFQMKKEDVIASITNIENTATFLVGVKVRTERIAIREILLSQSSEISK